MAIGPLSSTAGLEGELRALLATVNTGAAAEGSTPGDVLPPAVESLPELDEAALAAQRKADEEAEAAERERVDTLLEEARARFDEASDAEAELRRKMLEDLKFVEGEQWDPVALQERKADGRPALTINRMAQFVKQVVNASRESKPAILVAPVDGGADKDTAEVIQGMIRHIETESVASVAYDTSVEHQVKMGRGWLRVVTEYESERSFDQVARIKAVRDQFSILIDPAAVEFDRRDMRYAFVPRDLTRKEFERRYGKYFTEPGSLADFFAVGSKFPTWFADGGVRLCEYWYVVDVPDELLGFNGEAALASDNPPWADQATQRRRVMRPTVKWAIISANKIFTEGEWIGSRIPIVPVLGDEVEIEGRLDLKGMTRDAKDPARVYSYEVTSLVETVGNAPRSPWVGAVGQFKSMRGHWLTANRRNWPYLEYDPVAVGGVLAPPPGRQSAEAPILAIAQSIAQADQDLKASTGIFDPTLGSRGPEQSGRAIVARQRGADTANFSYHDNFSRALVSLGKLLVEIVPKLYSRRRIVRILGLDNQERAVMVQGPKPNEGEQAPAGVEGIFGIGVGRYDVTVSTGPSFQTRRQEQADGSMEMLRANPGLWPIVGDLVLESMDWPGAAGMADRIRKSLPDPLKPRKPGEGPSLEEVTGQLQALSEQNEKLTAALNAAHDALDGKALELASSERIKAAETISREKIAALQIQADLVKTEATLNGREAQASIDALQTMLADVADRQMAIMSALGSPGAPQTEIEGA